MSHSHPQSSSVGRVLIGRNFPSPLFCACLLMILVLAVFGEVGQFGFSHPADHEALLENPRLQPSTSIDLETIWLKPGPGPYLPLAESINATIAQFGHSLSEGVESFSPLVFHLSSLSLHLISVLLAFAILRVLLASATEEQCRTNMAALAGAALFAVHPIQTEIVASASALGDLFAGALSLAAILLYVHARPSESADSFHPARAVAYLMGTIFFTAALLSHPVAAALPIMLLVLDTAFLPNRNWKRSICMLAPWLLIAAGLFLHSYRLQSPDAGFVLAPLWLRPYVMIDSAGFYLAKLFWPFGLTVNYGRGLETLSETGIRESLCWIPMLLVFAALITGRNRWTNLAIFGLFLAALIPTTGLLPFHRTGDSLVADRFAYLAMLAAGAVVAHLIAATPAKFSRYVVVVFAAGILGASAVRTLDYLPSFRTLESTLRQSLAAQPDRPDLRFQLARHLEDEGNLAGAALEYRQLIHDRPDLIEPHLHLAALEMAEDRLAVAEPLLRHAITLESPLTPTAHRGLARLLVATGRAREGDPHFLIALRAAADDVGLCNDWARALESQDRHVEAATLYSKAAKMDGAPLVLRRKAAQNWLAADEVRLCLAELHTILESRTDDLFALNLMAWIRATSSDPDIRNGAEAVRLAEHAVGLSDKGDPILFDTLAAAYAANGRFSQAMAALEMMLSAARADRRYDEESINAVFKSREQCYRWGSALEGRKAPAFEKMAIR